MAIETAVAAEKAGSRALSTSCVGPRSVSEKGWTEEDEAPALPESSCAAEAEEDGAGSARLPHAAWTAASTVAGLARAACEAGGGEGGTPCVKVPRRGPPASSVRTPMEQGVVALAARGSDPSSPTSAPSASVAFDAAHAPARRRAVPLSAPKAVERIEPPALTVMQSLKSGQSVGCTETATAARPIAEPSAPVSVQARVAGADDAGARKAAARDTWTGTGTGAAADDDAHASAAG